MSNTLSHANRYTGKLSSDAINTFAGIAASIEHHASLNAWDRANSHMRSALIQAKAQAKNKKEFLTLAKQATGIAKNTHPLLVWCSENWKF